MTITALGAILFLAATPSKADPPTTLLVGARIHLTTSSYTADVLYTSRTINGFVRPKSVLGPGPVTLPGTIIDGYVSHKILGGQLPGIDWADAVTQLARKGKIHFWLAGDIVELRYPVPILVSTGSFNPFFLPASIVSKIEKWPGPFNGRNVYGQPFYLPADQAQALRLAPVFTCKAAYAETPDVRWISHSKKVGEAQLSPICGSREPPSQEQIDGLLANQGVFVIGIPSD